MRPVSLVAHPPQLETPYSGSAETLPIVMDGSKDLIGEVAAAELDHSSGAATGAKCAHEVRVSSTARTSIPALANPSENGRLGPPDALYPLLACVRPSLLLPPGHGTCVWERSQNLVGSSSSFFALLLTCRAAAWVTAWKRLLPRRMLSGTRRFASHQAQQRPPGRRRP